ncbi:hypothetical protein CYLTODRAFT_50810 [Cylindrobasidium torrendii FP15055 ss-10]|uniref:Major facilitator superfamily (MFS) profile domain-containing protein n=1 Tax=Cylindrobasidium torrendii FP15055 ss-10 TaxID=1314674 RepID=A0A0D7B6M3_9AGAR|nr:hypothetical protein CYLTODRAFT_50810 [Cylindrobasidium torrendii FP15055 ss-10]
MASRNNAPEWTVVDFIHRGPWWTNRGIVLLNLCLLLSLVTSTVNGLDSSLINGLQILPEWQAFFHHPTGKWLGLIQCAQNMGGIAALPFTPIVSDKLGRRASLFVGSILLLAGVAMQFAASTIHFFIAARVVLGFGLAFCTNSAPVLLIELAYPTQRGKFTSFYNSLWYTGSICSAWVCYGAFKHSAGSMWSWRLPTLIQGIGPLLQLVFIWFTPESPRFLVSKGMEGQAARILAKYHANGGDERDPLVVFELAQIRHALRMEEENNKAATFFSLLATPGNRRRTMIIVAIAIFSQWSGNGLVSFYINLVLEGIGIKDTETKAAINGGLQIFNLAVALAGASLIDWVGRRTLFLVSNAGMLVVFVCWTITEALFNELQLVAAAKATVPLIFLYYFFYDIAYSPMLVAYTLEILPYKIRAKGFALMNAVVMITVTFNQFVNPWALGAMGWWYYVVYCGFLCVELLFIIKFVVETKGRTLEETAAIFDGTEQEEVLTHLGGDAANMTLPHSVALEVYVGQMTEVEAEGGWQSRPWAQDKESEVYLPDSGQQSKNPSRLGFGHSSDDPRAI